MTRPITAITPTGRPTNRSWGEALQISGVALLAIAVGLLVARYNAGSLLASRASAGKATLGVLVFAALVAFRRRATTIAGPGAQIAGFTLALGSFLGLLVREPVGTTSEAKVAVLLAVGTLMFLAGSAAAGLFVNRGRPGFELSWGGIDPFRSRAFLAGSALLLLAAFANLATGSVPILAGNIDAARFAGAGGVFNQLWTWIIGGTEAVFLIAAVRTAAKRRLDFRVAALGGASAIVLVALAARSFLLIVGMAAIVAVAALGRVSPIRLAVLAALGLLALGVAGQLRVERSQGQQTAAQAIKQSLGIGPSVFATVLQEVPQVVGFQHGGFFLRDFRAAAPLHPFGRPQPADIWVTEMLRHRDPLVVGGTPPTLAGGLYIDFGVPGVVVGATLLGALLALLYRWTCDRRTLGALALYAYVTSYIALSAYSYVSLKPAVIAAVAVCFALDRVERSRRAATRLV